MVPSLGLDSFLPKAFSSSKEDFFSYEKEAIKDGAGRCRQSAGKAGIHSRLTTARSSGAAAPPFHKFFFLFIVVFQVAKETTFFVNPMFN